MWSLSEWGPESFIVISVICCTRFMVLNEKHQVTACGQIRGISLYAPLSPTDLELLVKLCIGSWDRYFMCSLSKFYTALKLHSPSRVVNSRSNVISRVNKDLDNCSRSCNATQMNGPQRTACLAKGCTDWQYNGNPYTLRSKSPFRYIPGDATSRTSGTQTDKQCQILSLAGSQYFKRD